MGCYKKPAMENWIKVTFILCAFGTLREIRPSEPFVTEFLLGDWWNVTNIQLYSLVYPVGTYSYLLLLVIIFLITDFFRFKPVIILSGISGIVVYAILLWTSSIEWLLATQFFYGLYIATEVAYFTYIYAKVDSAKYPIVTSYTRIAALTGRFLSGVSSQLLVYFNIMDYRQLNYITFTAQILATFWAFLLPEVMYSIYFHRRSSFISQTLEPNTPKTEIPKKQKLKEKVSEAWWLILRHAKSAYTRPLVLVWSSLYATSLALYVQTQNYVQLLWSDIQNATQYTEPYNGAVEATTTLLGAGGAYMSSIWTMSALPAFITAVQGVTICLATAIPNVFVSYAGYIVTGVLFHFLITLSSAKIASQLADESCFGLIFGINTFIGTALQSLLTVLIQSMQFSIYWQYYSISALYLIQAFAWLLGWIINWCSKKRKSFSLQIE